MLLSDIISNVFWLHVSQQVRCPVPSFPDSAFSVAAAMLGTQDSVCRKHRIFQPIWKGLLNGSLCLSMPSHARPSCRTFIGWSSKRFRERNWHIGIPLILSGIGFM